MDIQRKAFESSNNVNPDWSFKFDEELQQYVATDFEMTNQVDEFNEHWDTFRAAWQAKAQAVPEGYVLVKVSDIAKLAIAVSRVDLMTYSEERPDSEKLAWQNVANKLEAMIEPQEPANDSC